MINDNCKIKFKEKIFVKVFYVLYIVRNERNNLKFKLQV